ncbi:MAG: hypothetical protein ACRCXZ_00950 [Patescibacteria group bacterium]
MKNIIKVQYSKKVIIFLFSSTTGLAAKIASMVTKLAEKSKVLKKGLNLVQAYTNKSMKFADNANIKIVELKSNAKLRVINGIEQTRLGQ